MFSADKIFLLLVAGAMVGAETAKRDLSGLQPGLEFLHLGGFGPVSRLSSHSTFAHLGLTSQQAVGFINILLQNGFLNPHALRLVAKGQPFGGNFQSPLTVPFSGHFHGFPAPLFDPYFLYLMSNYARFLPYGLGPQGIYGSTGLPSPRHPDKN